MPGFDGTGPQGQGPLTGRGLGYCAGAVPVGRGRGIGLGRGFGRGFGPGRGFGLGLAWRRGFGGGWRWMIPESAPMSAEDEAAELRRELTLLENRAEMIRAALERLKGEQEGSK